MKIYKLLLIVFTFCFVLGTPYLKANEQECRKIPDQIEKAIKEHMKKIKGAEYCEFRSIVEGDIDGNGTMDLIIEYNIEGACYDVLDVQPGSCGNKHTTFLTVFLKHHNGLTQITPIKVGGRGERSISDLKIVNGHIEANTLEYNETDAMCCPSKEGSTVFSLINGELKEER